MFMFALVVYTLETLRPPLSAFQISEDLHWQDSDCYYLPFLAFLSFANPIGKCVPNYFICGRWLRIWTGACNDPLCAEERLDLFHNIILLTRQQPLTAESISL